MKRFILTLLLVAGSAAAQSTSSFNLNDGKIQFSVPQGWSAIIEKSDGNPQAIIFQVTDPATAGTDDAATVTVKTRQLKSPEGFAAATADEMALSRAQSGYEIALDGSETGAHHYFVMRGKTRYSIHDRFSLVGNIAVQVRCQRPLLDATTKAWSASFDSDCKNVAASVK